MAIAIKEYLGNEGLKVDWNYIPNKDMNLSESSMIQLNDPICESSLMVDIEGIHVGPTRNFTWYTEDALKGSVPTWTKPYLRPLIMHHNEKDGKIIGRVRHAEYTDVNTRSDTGALVFTTNIPDKEGKEQLLDGRLNTTSIGVIVHSATCTICGHNIAQEGECEHDRGLLYDGKICYWMIHEMEAKELSYVIVPSDVYAHNLRIYKPAKKTMQEMLKEGVLNLAEAKNINQKEETIIDEVVKDEDKKDDKVLDEVVKDKDKKEDKKEDKDLAEINKDLEMKIKELETDKETSTNDLKKVSADLLKAQEDLKKIQDTLSEKEKDLSQEIALRESIESKLIEIDMNVKEELSKKIISLREELNKKVVEKDTLLKRTEESLKDSILDLEEELSNPAATLNIKEATNPSLVEDEENKKIVVKEEEKASNIDLAEGLENLFSEIVGRK